MYAPYGLASHTVGLSTVVVHPQPVFVDRTPPQAGSVRDGSTPLRDIQYQSSTTEVCVNFNGFVDQDSGISSYVWSVMSGGGELFQRELSVVEMTHQTACETVSPLRHNSRYYSVLTTVNGGVNEMNATSMSDGGVCAVVTEYCVPHHTLWIAILYTYLHVCTNTCCVPL